MSCASLECHWAQGSQSWQRQGGTTSSWGCNARAIRPILHLHQENGHFTNKPTPPVQPLSQLTQIDNLCTACRLQPGKTEPWGVKHLPMGSSHLKAVCWVTMLGYPRNFDLYSPIAFNILETSNSCSGAGMSRNVRSYSNFLRDVQLWKLFLCTSTKTFFCQKLKKTRTKNQLSNSKHILTTYILNFCLSLLSI